jgi:hypothetical protein
MIPVLLGAVTALVLVDDTALRAAPRETSARQAVLFQGDALEVRGERLGYLQVYDHRLERGGYVKATSARQYNDAPEELPALKALVEFLRDSSGQESLGIAHVALYLKAAPSSAITPDIFDALGTMADRLSRRASARFSKPDDPVAGQLEVATGFGVKFNSFDVEGGSQVCYDGEAFGQVLALKGNAVQRARAVLGLTRLECIDPRLTPVDRRRLDEWREDLFAHANTADIPQELRDRLRLRHAGVLAALAFERLREGDTTGSRSAGEVALRELSLVDRDALPEFETAGYDAAGVRVGASRWAAASAAPPPSKKLWITTGPGEPGQTCVNLLDPEHDEQHPLLEKCTYGVVWTASARASRSGTALALAIQPTAAWRELWVFHRTGDAWTADVLAASNTEPDVGYLEFAGWSPDGAHLLAVRETRVQGRFRKSFELLNVATLAVEKHADKPGSINSFIRWQEPDWKAETVALR